MGHVVLQTWRLLKVPLSGQAALLLTADVAKGAIVDADGVVALQQAIPQLEVVHIPGAGHNIRREQFARYMEVVQSFLRKHVV